MAKSKRSLVLILSLVMLVLALGSVLAVSGVFVRPATQVEAAETRAPGLYETGNTTNTPTKTWDKLLELGEDNGGISITEMTINGKTYQLLRTSTDLEGDLVCGEVSGLTSLNRAFDDCSKLTSISFTENFNTSNVTDMRGMFGGCSSLTSLDLSSFNTSNVTDMSSMFSHCTSLKSINLSNFDTSSVTNMNYMFSNCSSLTSLDVSSFNTSSVTNMNYMFFWCSSLNTLDVSKFDTSNVTSMHWMFYGCTALKSLDVSKFDTSKVTNFTAMFGGTKLTVLDMAGFDFSAVENISNTMGMLGINDTYCQAVLKQKSSNLLLAYQTAMQNQNISLALSSVSSDLATMYSNAIVEKTDKEIGYIGRVYVVGIVINEMFYSKNNIERALVDAQTLFDTKIGTIYAPASAISMDISLPYNVNYVYKANDGNTALPAQMLYGYNDIDSSLTELALFEGTLKDPAPKPSETEQTGVVADISMVVIALVSTIGLIVIATKKKRIAR